MHLYKNIYVYRYQRTKIVRHEYLLAQAIHPIKQSSSTDMVGAWSEQCNQVTFALKANRGDSKLIIDRNHDECCLIDHSPNQL
jgi:hypothetical protein